MVVFFKVKLSKFYVVSSSKGRSRWDKKRSASSQKKYIQEVGSDNFALQRWRCIFYSHKHCTFFLQSILTDLVQFNRNDNNPQLLSILYAHRWTLRGINKYNSNYYVRINVIKTPETTVAMKSLFFFQSLIKGSNFHLLVQQNLFFLVVGIANCSFCSQFMIGTKYVIMIFNV